MGYNPSAFSQILNGHVPVSKKFLRRLAAYDPMVNTDWVTTGIGSIFVAQHATEDNVQYTEDKDMVLPDDNPYGGRFHKEGKQLYITVKHVPCTAFGRFAKDFPQTETIAEELGEETYEMDRLSHCKYLSFEVQGNSMDTGSRHSFEAGDKVLVRELKKELWTERLRLDDWPYWIIVTGSTILLKQMIAQDQERGILTFHSLNPSPEYANFSLRIDDIRGLYRVIKKKPKEVWIAEDECGK